MIIIPQIKTITVNQEGSRVNIIHDKGIIELPWDAALEIAKAMIIQARKAEEIAKAEAIAYDQAILTRLGIPIGLTSHPIILKEAKKEAAWNTNLRRYIPSGKAKGIKSQSVVGSPTLIMHPPVKNKKEEK